MPLLQGEDSVNASGETASDFYCFYTDGNYANGTVTIALFPGKSYVGITVTASSIDGADVFDIENGDGTPEQAPYFVSNARPPNLNLPTLYANMSTMPAVRLALTQAGIPRTSYYLWQADWNNRDAVPAGYDMAQWQNTVPFDRDVAYDYVFRKTGYPAKQVGTVRSHTTGGTATVYTVDGGQTWFFHKPEAF